LKVLNKGRFDWDLEKAERRKAKIKAMTLAEWLDQYVALGENNSRANTYKDRKVACGNLKRVFGNTITLSEVTKVRIMEYKKRRVAEPRRNRYRGFLEGRLVSRSTVNHEINILMSALGLAAEEKLCEEPPRIKRDQRVKRERILTDHEYQSLLDHSPRWLQRIFITGNETALDIGGIGSLTWDSIKDGLIVVSRQKTGVKQRIGISPALKVVLDELREEYQRVPNLQRLVFAKNGKRMNLSSLHYSFLKAFDDAKVEGFQFRDFRHCCRTRWAAAGLPFEIAETGLGHKMGGISGTYLNLTDDHIRAAFQAMFTRCSQKSQDSLAVREKLA